MNDESSSKKEWTQPEIYDLDVDSTASGDIHPTEISTTAGPS